jgi:hypothetical protein
MMTQTLKIKRPVVTEHYRGIIEGMFEKSWLIGLSFNFGRCLSAVCSAPLAPQLWGEQSESPPVLGDLGGEQSNFN